jgi:tetratricopeptide (TPR) repeat protein
MNKGKLLIVTMTSFAVLLGMAGTSSSMAGGMGYGAPPPQPQPQPQAPGMSSKPSDASNSTTTARREVGKPASEAIDLFKKHNYQDALSKIKEADAVSNKNPYEEYLVAKLLGQILGQLHQDTEAAAALDRAVASNGAPKEELADLLRLDMAYNINVKSYAKAISAGEQMQQLGPMDGDTTGDFALAYYLKGDYSNALKTAKVAMDLQSAKGSPNVQTLEVLMNSQIKTRDTTGSKQTLAKLCGMPSPPAELKCSSVGK